MPESNKAARVGPKNRLRYRQSTGDDIVVSSVVTLSNSFDIELDMPDVVASYAEHIAGLGIPSHNMSGFDRQVLAVHRGDSIERGFLEYALEIISAYSTKMHGLFPDFLVKHQPHILDLLEPGQEYTLEMRISREYALNDFSDTISSRQRAKLPAEEQKKWWAEEIAFVDAAESSRNHAVICIDPAHYLKHYLGPAYLNSNEQNKNALYDGWSENAHEWLHVFPRLKHLSNLIAFESTIDSVNPSERRMDFLVKDIWKLVAEEGIPNAGVIFRQDFAYLAESKDIFNDNLKALFSQADPYRFITYNLSLDAYEGHHGTYFMGESASLLVMADFARKIGLGGMEIKYAGNPVEIGGISGILQDQRMNNPEKPIIFKKVNPDFGKLFRAIANIGPDEFYDILFKTQKSLNLHDEDYLIHPDFYYGMIAQGMDVPLPPG